MLFPAAATTVERFDGARARHAPELPPWRGRLAVLARAIPGGEIDGWLERLRVRRRDARVVAAAAVVPPKLDVPLAAASEPARVARIRGAAR